MHIMHTVCKVLAGQSDFSIEHNSMGNLYPLGTLTRHLYHHIFVYVERTPRALGPSKNVIYTFNGLVWLFVFVAFFAVVLALAVVLNWYKQKGIPTVLYYFQSTTLSNFITISYVV